MLSFMSGSSISSSGDLNFRIMDSAAMKIKPSWQKVLLSHVKIGRNIETIVSTG